MRWRGGATTGLTSSLLAAVVPVNGCAKSRCETARAAYRHQLAIVARIEASERPLTPYPAGEPTPAAYASAQAYNARFFLAIEQANYNARQVVLTNPGCISDPNATESARVAP